MNPPIHHQLCARYVRRLIRRQEPHCSVHLGRCIDTDITMSLRIPGSLAALDERIGCIAPGCTHLTVVLSSAHHTAVDFVTVCSAPVDASQLLWMTV